MTITDEIRQHIGWLSGYVSGTNESNWKDMRLRCERQIAELSALLAALGETHVVVPREPAAWLVGWHRANGEAGLTSYVNEDDARRAAKNLETYSASETMADVQPLYAVTSPERRGGES